MRNTKFSMRCICVMTVTLTLILNGCAPFALSRRYLIASPYISQPPAQDEYASASAFVVSNAQTDNTTQSQKNVFDLSGDAQAQLIKSVAESVRATSGTAEIKTILGIFGTDITSTQEKTAQQDIDRSVISKTIVLTVEKSTKKQGPADRIAQIRLELTLDSPAKNIGWKSWNKFETEYGTVDLAKLTQNSVRSLTGGLSGGPKAHAGTPVTAELNANMSRALTEEVTLKQRYIQMSGKLTTSTVSIIQEGTVGMDMAGNNSINLQIQLPGETLEFFEFNAPESKNSTDSSSKEGDYSFYNVKCPVTKEDIAFTLSGEYLLRHVWFGSNSISEADDCICMIPGRFKNKRCVLLKQDELKTPYWQIVKSASDKNHPLSLASQGEEGTKQLRFVSYKAAVKFLDWLRNSKDAKVGKDGTLEMDNKIIESGEIFSLEIRRFESTSSQQDTEKKSRGKDI
ncbi:TPA: hypothetical protein DDW35_04510 [Candidatus Sumerlaeota bacterium]|jgi:hypothetical protein|nr:hypothetical protein [Candidatus Sumerlaeota bacterium]